MLAAAAPNRHKQYRRASAESKRQQQHHGEKATVRWIGLPPLDRRLQRSPAGSGCGCKLGSLPHGLTEKNRSLLRRLEDPHLLVRLVNLPGQIWRLARKNLSTSPRSFIDLQTALAIDILLHVAPRIEDLAALKFDEHIHWPQGRGKPALFVFRQSKVPNGDPQEFELPAVLSERLYEFRNEIAASVIGRRPNVLFVSATGKPRTLSALRVAIQRTVLRRIGLKITPHQFRHLAAQIHLNANPSAYEVVRQFWGTKRSKRPRGSMPDPIPGEPGGRMLS
jgi:hypothetical protein